MSNQHLYTTGNKSGILDGALTIGIPAIITLLAIVTKSFWGDEVLSILYSSAPGLETFRLLAGDFHPPLYFLLLKFWISIAGSGEIALRVFQGMNGVAFLTVSLRLFRELFPTRRYHPFWLLLAFSPELWLFLPMLRYYLFAATLVIVSMLVFRRWMDSPTPRPLSALVFSWVALLYTDYPASVVIALQGILVLISNRRLFIRYILGAVAAGGMFVPWAFITIGQISKLRSVGQSADLNASPFALILKCVYSVYAFMMGETSYPFELFCGVILVTLTGMVLLGIIKGKVWQISQLWQSGLFLAGGILFTSLITTFVSTHTSFIYTPARTLFALVFFFIILAIIYDRMESQLLRVLLISSMVLASSYGCVNWALNRQFLMSVYATPWKAVMKDLNGKEGMVYADESLCYEYYRDHLKGEYPVLRNPYSVDGLSEGTASLAASGNSPDVYLILMGRESTESTIPVDITSKLESKGKLQSELKYLPIGESYRAFKAKILHRDSYDAKVTVRHYTMSPDSL